jgi:cysteine-S-conjugate beta-lyase
VAYDDPFDISDAELRRAWSVKWTHAPEGTLPAWVAEMDARPCPPVQDAVREAVERGTFGYPPIDTSLVGLPQALAVFARERYGWTVDESLVVPCGDVMSGVRFVLETLCDPAPVVVPVPSYRPLLDVVGLTGRRLVPVPALDADRRLHLAAIEAALADGARTVLLCSPHNPLGRVWTVPELEGLRDVVARHGARVISDEIHAPLALPGARHVPYALLDGTAEHGTTVTSASKAWNVPGLKCAQIVLGSRADRAALAAAPHVANHGLASLGISATLAAYRDGTAWLDHVVPELAARRDQLGTLLAERLPQVRWVRPEGGYLAWLEVPGVEDPAGCARAAGVLVSRGPEFGGLGLGLAVERSVRLVFATSAERLQRIAERLAQAWAT